MKQNCIYLDSETLQLSTEAASDRIVFRSYPDTVELKKFNFECINECGDKWEMESLGSDSNDAISIFKLLYPNDKILTVTE